MRNLHKLLTPAILFAPIFALLAGCQTTSANSGSAITQTAAEAEAAVCSDLLPPPFTSEQEAELTDFWLEYIGEMLGTWADRCK